MQNFYLKSLAKDFGRETKDDLCMGIRALPDDGAAQIRKSERTKQVEWNPDLAEVYYTLFVASRVANEYSNIRIFESVLFVNEYSIFEYEFFNIRS